MAKKMTQANRLQAYRWATMHQVLLLTGWPEGKYGYMMYNSGLQYLKIVLKGDKYAIDQLIHGKSFWGWWRLNWYIREQDFVKSAELYNWGIHQCRYRFWMLNNAEQLTDANNHYGRILEDSYCRDVVKGMR